jgi:hypothetical protein
VRSSSSVRVDPKTSASPAMVFLITLTRMAIAARFSESKFSSA